MRRVLLAIVLIGLASSALSQQTIVFPAVTDEVEGLNGSVWMTVVRVIKVNPLDSITLTRKWVCLPGGGFREDSDGWQMTAPDKVDRFDMAWGHQLLEDTGRQVGGMAFEVEGGEVIAHSYVVDVSRGVHHPDYLAAGQGQYIKALEEPLQGPSHIPYIAGCRTMPCSSDTSSVWEYYRNNIGILNPNPESLGITATVIPFGVSSGRGYEIVEDDPETFSRIVPPYGWLQFPWLSDANYGFDNFGGPIFPHAGFLINLTPEKDLPYYAYASVVFTPDPDSGIPIFNDPMFVPAEPGYVAPFSEVDPPKGEEE